MRTYVLIDNSKRTAGIVLNNLCYLKLIAAKSKKSAKKVCLENQSVITLSNFTPYERQKIYKALGMTVPHCCGNPCALNTLNYWRCSTCQSYYPIVKRPHGGIRKGAGRKPDFTPNRPLCCGRPVNKHSNDRWRCPICKTIFNRC
jgi:rubrerythrin